MSYQNGKRTSGEIHINKTSTIRLLVSLENTVPLGSLQFNPSTISASSFANGAVSAENGNSVTIK
jgi:hypothetical protein